jgi:hypothetical protein
MRHSVPSPWPKGYVKSGPARDPDAEESDDDDPDEGGGARKKKKKAAGKRRRASGAGAGAGGVGKAGGAGEQCLGMGNERFMVGRCSRLMVTKPRLLSQSGTRNFLDT